MLGRFGWIYVVAFILILGEIATAEVLVTVATGKQDPARVRNLLDGNGREYLAFGSGRCSGCGPETDDDPAPARPR